MAGIYIHIPFCHMACPYCDFYFLTNKKWKEPFLEALLEELPERSDEVTTSLASIYFGGGTPSMLNPGEMERILTGIRQHYIIDEKVELTLEANPEDLTEQNLDSWQSQGFNRLSIGVQSLNDKKLKSLGRNHSSHEAVEGIRRAQEAGFSNINVDLIFATSPEEGFTEDLNQFLALNVQHISAYGLTVEEGTPLAQSVGKGRKTLVEDQEYRRQFLQIHQTLGASGFEHYEISNYALDGYKSRHNSAYWNRTSYIGLGPSAHSFSENERRWNAANLPKYCENREYEVECLSEYDRYNEMLMTGFRQKQGLDLELMRKIFLDKTEDLLQQSKPFIVKKLMEIEGNFLRLSLEGMLLSDHICSELFWIDED